MFTWEREETGRPLDTGVGEVGERPAWSVEGMVSRSRGRKRSRSRIKRSNWNSINSMMKICRFTSRSRDSDRGLCCRRI